MVYLGGAVKKMSIEKKINIKSAENVAVNLAVMKAIQEGRPQKEVDTLMMEKREDFAIKSITSVQNKSRLIGN